jgi:hypothetical protein
VRATLLAVVVINGGPLGVAYARDRQPFMAASPAKASRIADAPASAPRRSAGARAAPSSPPLSSGGAVDGGGAGDEQGEGGSPQGEVDPLVSNGLGSPLCKGALGGGELSVVSRRDCETSGFVAAAAPTGAYGIDVHIDTGVLGLSSGGLLTTVQDLFVTPLWMALVWAVHALVVMLEWCFTIDLLDNTSVGDGVARGLRQVQGAFTQPWLATVLAVAAVLAAYNGLVRRRVAETVGQALLVLAMTAGGIWVMLDPTGTVGALGGWANEASLGTLAVTAHGTPARAGGALADSMGTVFAASIEVPWCYLEFGDVGWCRNPARLDPRLRAAGLQIASGELALVGCRLNTSWLSVCVAPGSSEAKALEHSAQLLRGAQTNGAIFLALPANGPARNAINEPGSLLRVMCQSDDATNCRGADSAQAEFRTNRGTWSRVGGLLLIAVGVFGMLLLLGFLTLRLLAAALLSLLYLMLAPAAVLAPALGEGGRAIFRKWSAQLLGAVVSKLLFAFLLGVVLAILAILAKLEALGWWTQWLLMSAFWWGAFARRHQALQIAGSAWGHDQAGTRRTVLQRVGNALDSSRRVIGGARATRERFSKPLSGAEQGRASRQPGRERLAAAIDDQARRTLEYEYRDARANVDAAPEVRERLSSMRTQLERVRGRHGDAVSVGDARRAAQLWFRAQRIEGEMGREQENLNAARAVANDGERALGRTGVVFSHERAAEREQFLNDQAALPASARARGPDASARRDYAALAGLAGHGRREYEQLEPSRKRAARLEIDRELALRRDRSQIGQRATAGDVATGDGEVPLPGPARRGANRASESALEGWPRDRGHVGPRTHGEGSALDSRQQDGRGDPGSPDRPESSVMRDAREVAARRKRQLGRDRR